MNILTISTLYDKGGAAYIARTLHHGFLEKGYRSIYYAGYGKRGFPNKKISDTVKYANFRLKIAPHINYIFHRIFGKDILSPNTNEIYSFLEWADVVICHTLHSHFLNYKDFFSLVLKHNKKIILVAHDSWHYTGRCAFIHSCELWKNGCSHCNNLSFYPSAIFDKAKLEFNSKTSHIGKLKHLKFVTPARWIAQNLNETYKNHSVTVIRNGIDTSQFKNANSIKTNNIVVSCVGIDQPGKVDLMLVKELLNNGIKIHFIGSGNPFDKHPNAINHGFISDRNELIKILSSCNFYLFSSTIDIYPTVLIEAICSGCYIFYTKSKGAEEIMSDGNNWLGKEVKDSESIIKLLSSKDFNNELYNTELREHYRQKALTFFSSETMINSYLKLLTSI